MAEELAAGNALTLGSWAGASLEWQVMEVLEDRVLLLCKECPEARALHSVREEVGWKDSGLRKWLNETFFNEAFTDAEKSEILSVRCETPDSVRYKTPGCGPTEDRVFLLSYDEAVRLFEKSVDRQVQPTSHAAEGGAYQNAAGFCWWWLRAPGVQPDYGATVSIDGWVDGYGHLVSDAYVGVRPAVFIRK